MISLQRKIAVYVNDGQIAQHVAELLARKYGGSTSLLGFGWWISQDTAQIENVYYVFAFCKEIKKEDLDEIVKKISQWLDKEEAIAMEIDGRMFLFSPKENVIID